MGFGTGRISGDWLDRQNSAPREIVYSRGLKLADYCSSSSSSGGSINLRSTGTGTDTDINTGTDAGTGVKIVSSST